jgi:hypothetical protein
MTTPNQPMSQLWPLTVTVPAGTPATSPLIVPWPLVDANLDFIDIIVPDGHNGLTGVAVYWSGTQIVPWGTESWIVANNEKIHTPTNTYITVSGLSVYAYNTGVFPHSFYLRAHVTYTTNPVVGMEGPIGTTAEIGSPGAVYNESISPAGIGSASIGLQSESPAFLTEGEESSLTALPETVS